MTTTTSSENNFLKIESTDFDLNTLFNFQASFDQLKYVLAALARTQKKVLDRVVNVERNVNITNVDSNGFVIGGHSENQQSPYKKMGSGGDTNKDEVNNDEQDDGDKLENDNHQGSVGEVQMDFLMVINKLLYFTFFFYKGF